MKSIFPLLALTLAAASAPRAEDAGFEALCAANGGQLRRAGVSGVQRLDCVGPAVSWFLVLKDGERVVAHYVATRETGWKPAIEAALADLEVICGSKQPLLQFAARKLLADCGGTRK